ncbi:MAG: hypothetical protein ACXACY_28660 [Candidatus Hodarchaeales archaeon]|jgi:hypothetical protein
MKVYLVVGEDQYDHVLHLSVYSSVDEAKNYIEEQYEDDLWWKEYKNAYCHWEASLSRDQVKVDGISEWHILEEEINIEKR